MRRSDRRSVGSRGAISHPGRARERGTRGQWDVRGVRDSIGADAADPHPCQRTDNLERRMSPSLGRWQPGGRPRGVPDQSLSRMRNRLKGTALTRSIGVH